MTRIPKNRANPAGAFQLGRPAALASLLLLAAAPAAAQGIRASVDRTEVTVEDQIRLQVVVEGSRTARPTLPDLPDFHLVSAGTSQQMQVVNGRSSASVAYSYVLLPRRTGTFNIGAASVEIGGKTYQSTPFSVRVLEASAQPQASQDIFVRTTVSDTGPWVGQQVTWSLRIYRRIDAGNFQMSQLDFDGFTVEDLGEVRQYNTTLRGQDFAVIELLKAIFPQEAGTHVLPAAELSCDVVVQASRGRRRSLLDDFFSRNTTQRKILRSSPIEMQVKPLPPAPADFSGLVGDFRIAADLSKRELKVGESVNLKLTVRGTGNVQMIGEPKMPEVATFKVYDSRPSTSIDRNGKTLSGSKTYVKDLVPLKAGELTLPGLQLVYFDPSEAIYRTASSPSFLLAVAPGDGTESTNLTEGLSPEAGKVAVKILADDILPIYTRLDAAEPAPPWQGPVWLGAVAAPPLLWLGLLTGLKRQERFQRDAGLRRRKAAVRKLGKTAAQVRAAVERGDAAEAARLASRGLREFVGDKLGIEGSALTPAEVAEHLRSRGIEADQVERTQGLLDRLEAAQYGARVEQSALDSLPREIESLCQELDRGLRG